MKLVVALGNQADYQFDIVLNDNSFTHKWVKELAWNLDNNQLDQDHIFAFLLTTEQKIKCLREAVAKINSFMHRDIISLPDILDENDNDFFNDLHEKFEKLAGSTSKPSKLFYIAPDNVKKAIRNLNSYCHALESPGHTKYHVPIQFNLSGRRRFALDKSDYDFFKNECIGGKIYLSYTEVGKNFRDLCKDNLPIDYIAAKNTHFYSGDFHLNLSTSKESFEDKIFKNWCEANNVDYNDKTLGIGFIELGTIVQPVEEVKSQLQKLKFISGIQIEDI